MKSVISFNVKGIAQTKGSARSFIPRGWKRAIITNDNPKNKDWATLVRMVAQMYAPKGGPWDGPVELCAHFWLKKPKSHPKTRFLWHTKKPDLDKITRSIKDALSGVIYMDDRQVVSMHMLKDYGDAPGVDIKLINVTEYKRIWEEEHNGKKINKSIAK